jgi:hypothetical protein
VVHPPSRDGRGRRPSSDDFDFIGTAPLASSGYVRGQDALPPQQAKPGLAGGPGSGQPARRRRYCCRTSLDRPDEGVRAYAILLEPLELYNLVIVAVCAYQVVEICQPFFSVA